MENPKLKYWVSFICNDNVVLRGIDKGMGLLQLAGLGVLAAGLFKKKD